MAMHEAIDVLNTWQRALSHVVAEAQLDIRQELEAKGEEPFRYGTQPHPDDKQYIIVYSEDRNGEPQARRFVRVVISARFSDPDAEYKKTAK